MLCCIIADWNLEKNDYCNETEKELTCEGRDLFYSQWELILIINWFQFQQLEVAETFVTRMDSELDFNILAVGWPFDWRLVPLASS